MVIYRKIKPNKKFNPAFSPYEEFHKIRIITTLLICLIVFTNNIYSTTFTSSRKRRWPTKDSPVTISYYVNNYNLNSFSIWNWRNAAMKAFNTWQNISEGIFIFKLGDPIQIKVDLINKVYEPKFGQNDPNLITCITDQWPEIWKTIPPIDDGIPFPIDLINQENIPILAVTKTHRLYNRKEDIEEIFGFDIFINCVNFNWKSKQSYFLKKELSFDIENVLCHETGHVLGIPDLKHHDDNKCTMYEIIGLGEILKRSLSKKDISLFKNLYRDNIKLYREYIKRK